MQFPGGGTLDFFDSCYSTSQGATYTFSTDLSICYITCPKNVTATPTYTGDGTLSTLYVNSNNYLAIYMITGVKSGDKFKSPNLSVGTGNTRTFTFFLGKT